VEITSKRDSLLVAGGMKTMTQQTSHRLVNRSRLIKINTLPLR